MGPFPHYHKHCLEAHFLRRASPKHLGYTKLLQRSPAQPPSKTHLWFPLQCAISNRCRRYTGTSHDVSVAGQDDNPRPTALGEPASGGHAGCRMYQANAKEAFDYARPFRARSISPPKGALLNSMLSCAKVLYRRGRGAAENVSAELRKSASEKGPWSFGEALRRRARGASEKGFGEGPAGLRRSASEKRPRSFGEVLRRRAHAASQEGVAELLREALLEWLQKFAPASAGAPQISLGSSGPGPEVSKPAWPPLASFPCSCGLPCASPLTSAEAQRFYQSLSLQSSRGNQGGGQLGRTGRGPSESLQEPAKASEKVLASLLTLRQ